MLNGHLRGLVPRGVKGRIKQFIRKSSLSADNIVGTLYTPAPMRAAGEHKLAWSRARRTARKAGDPLPVPPQDLTMGYIASDEVFLRSGQTTSAWLRRIMEREGIRLAKGTAAAEWGCASGRVLRHFEREANECEFWGLDQDGAHLNWAKQNLAPPFKFLRRSREHVDPQALGTFDDLAQQA